MCRLALLNQLEREAALAECHADLKARKDMEELQEQQQQVAQMRAAVAEQKKRSEQESLKMSRKVRYLL
jgi:hypothetical protein